VRRPALLTFAIVVAGCRAGTPAPVTPREAADSRYLFVWAGDADKRESDFLAVVDVDRHNRTYAEVIPKKSAG
jgi:hypothetical protein